MKLCQLSFCCGAVAIKSEDFCPISATTIFARVKTHRHCNIGGMLRAKKGTRAPPRALLRLERFCHHEVIMRHFRGSLLLASFLAGAPLLAMSALPAQAQFSANISFDSFHGTLSSYGDWLYSDRWGEVWRPMSQDRDRDWRPYWAGRWASTREYGWTWISDEGEWGDIAYHYGRWVYDPDDGWLWLPGYVWSPAWVVWRSSGPDVGWMPMPPDDGFLRPSGISISIGFGDWNDIGGYYGYSRWYGSSFDRQRFGRLWTFVPGERLSDPGYRRYALARPQTINIIQNSRNITNYTVVNNTIINRSVNTTVFNQGGRAPQPVAANTVLRNTRWVTPVNQGEQIQNRARQERPHGDGRINSAPAPTPEQIRTLSTRAVPTLNANARTNAGGAPGNTGNDRDNRNAPRHLFSQANAQELQARARGGQQQPGNAPQPAPQSGPGNTQGRDNNREGRNPPSTQQPPAQQPAAQPPTAQQPTAQQPTAQQPSTPPPQPGNDERGPRNRDNNARDNASRDNNGRDNNGRGVERPQTPAPMPPAATPPAAQPERTPPMPPAAVRPPPPNNPSTEDRGNRGPGADRPPRALPDQPPTPPAAVEQRPQAVPEQAREPARREQQPQRQMEQRTQDRTPERAAPPREQVAPPPRVQAAPPPREQAAPQAQPPQREQAQPRAQPQPREQARPDTPPPDRGPPPGRGNGRGRDDDNR
jgi:hypothetical protein